MLDIKTKRQILDNAAAKGRFFQVEFIKKDGSKRTMNCKKWVESAFTYGSANAQANTCAHKENIYSVVDVSLENQNGGKGAFRNINLDTLISVTSGGEKITFSKK